MEDGAAVATYRLGDALGQGGFSTVYAATHARWGHPLAVKVAHASLSQPGIRRAFQDEVRAVAALDHRHVVRIYDQGAVTAGEAEASGGRLVAGTPWLAMERARGVLRPPGDGETLRRALLELLDALQAVHALGILHLDIKPSNILVRDDGTHALSDFGVVLLRGPTAADPRTVTWGSPPYMAPERFDGRPERLVEATDLYAVGCLAYQLAAGVPPLHCPTWERAAEAHRTFPVPPLSPRVAVPPGFADWVATLLAKRPGDRFETAADARHALAGLGPCRSSDQGAVAVVVEQTLTLTALGEPVPLERLLTAAAPPTPAPLPARWHVAPPARRLEGVGLGLLGLLGVPFVGRAEERSALWGALESVVGGEGPRAVTLEGPAGVGRSRLGEAFVAAAAGPCAVVRVRGGQADPLGTALRAFAGLGAQTDPARAREAVALRLGRPPEDPAIAPIAALACRAAPEAKDVGAVLELLHGLAARRPVVLWIDDLLQDPRGVEVVEAAMARGPERLLVVAAVCDQRRVGQPPQAARLDALGPTRLRLAPLDVPTARALLASWVGLGPELVADLAERCEGSITLALQMVREGLAAGRLRPGRRGLEAASEHPEPLPLPEAALEAWACHLPRGTAWEEGPLGRALERAAVLGARVDRQRLVGALGDEGLARSLEREVLDRGLAVETGQGFAWASPALRACVLQQAGGRLAAHHLACAAAWPGEEASDRWARGGHLLEAGEVQAALGDLLSSASDRIAAGHMADAALRLQRLEQAMEREGIPEGDPDWGRLWQARATLGPTHQGYTRCRAWNERAVRVARRHPQDAAWRRVRRQAVGGLAWLTTVQLLPREARRWLDEEASILAEEGIESAYHHDRVGWYALIAGDPLLAVRSFGRALELARRDGERHVLYVADASLGVALSHAGDPGAVEHLGRAGAAMLDAGYVSARADLAVALGDACRHQGDFDQEAPELELLGPAVEHLLAVGLVDRDVLGSAELAARGAQRLGRSDLAERAGALVRVQRRVLAALTPPAG